MKNEIFIILFTLLKNSNIIINTKENVTMA